jgi:hypothetical protein
MTWMLCFDRWIHQIPDDAGVRPGAIYRAACGIDVYPLQVGAPGQRRRCKRCVEPMEPDRLAVLAVQSGGGPGDLTALVEFMAVEPGMVERVLTEHVRDAHQDCAGCGWQRRVRWPCVHCLCAHAALELRASRGAGPPRPVELVTPVRTSRRCSAARVPQDSPVWSRCGR